jgi:3-deoxy-D-manno-oct-2-ulosonic acid (Kdo) hydroxylase
MKNLETFDLAEWEGDIPADLPQKVIKALEEGKVVYFPRLSFPLQSHEIPLLSPQKTDPKSKNISYDHRNDRLSGTQCSETEAQQLKEFVSRYSKASRRLMDQLFPSYRPHLLQARTSLRPVEIAGRKSSYRKDDTLLHVDSFPATPSKGNRILRFFTNINPAGKPRIWRVGEPFPDVVKKMAPRTHKPFLGVSYLLKWLKITKDYRSLYDHYMLQIHDNMKGDLQYQKHVPQEEIHFPPGCTWIVYTDQVSHAAMSGQHVLEQTYHIPSTAMQNPATTPLAILEKYFKKKLV